MAPTLMNTTATSLVLQWLAPTKPHGSIVAYRLLRNGTLVYSGTNMTVHDSPLAPFTVYTYVLEACNNIGCTSSSPTLLLTSEDGMLFRSFAPSASDNILSIFGSSAQHGSTNGVFHQLDIIQRILARTKHPEWHHSKLQFHCPSGGSTTSGRFCQRLHPLPRLLRLIHIALH